MSSQRRRRRTTGLTACLVCALCSPYTADVEAFSPFQRILRGSRAHNEADPPAHNAMATIVTAATVMATGIVLTSPLPSSAADVSPSDITTSILRRQMTTKLSESEAFKTLRREPPTSRAMRELTELQELQDARLDACADRGTLWEQCFMFGDSASDSSSVGGVGGTKAKRGATNLQNGLDYQYLSPIGALESGESSSGNNDQQLPLSGRPKTKVPTW